VSVVISATVVTDDPEHLVKAAEVLGRAAAGLGLEGIDVSLSITTVPDDPDEAEPGG
jgi:hypothetical protein